jgi:NADH-quinone oxidoreductase subunit H
VRIAVMLGKVMAAILFFMLARWSWPRFRFDQLMNIAWKVMLPWGLVNVVVVAFWIEYGDRIAAAVGLANKAAFAIVGFMALFLSWLVVTWADPTAADNRPLPWTAASKPGRVPGEPVP